MEVRDNLIVIGQVEYDALIKRIQYSEYKSECAIQMNKDLQDKVFPPVYDADGCEDAGVPREAVGTNDNVTISKEVLDELLNLVEGSRIFAEEVIKLKLNQNPDNGLVYAPEFLAKNWSNELKDVIGYKETEIDIDINNLPF
jgi:hypothetical protein